MNNFDQSTKASWGGAQLSPISVAIVTGSASRDAGGLLGAVSGLANSLGHNHCAVDVFAAEDINSRRDLHHWQGVQLRPFAILGPRGFKYAPGLQRRLNLARYDILHSHGLWTYSSIASTRWAESQRKPLIVSAHGMLDPWALKQSHAKKVLAAALYENAHLRKACCLHALSEAEALAFRAYGLTNPICIIPNGVDLPTDSELKTPPTWDRALPEGASVLLYLGRIHPKKGLNALLQGFHQCITSRKVDDSWFLVVAGWEQGGHLQELQALSDYLGLQDRVRFVGPQFEDEKKRSLQRADAFALPSLSEGLPMAVLEAWSHQVPVLMTSNCNLPVGFERGAAIDMGASPESISQAIAFLSSLSSSDRREMGKRGRALVAECFAWERVSTKVREMYDWALGGGARPTSFGQL